MSGNKGIVILDCAIRTYNPTTEEVDRFDNRKIFVSLKIPREFKKIVRFLDPNKGRTYYNALSLLMISEELGVRCSIMRDRILKHDWETLDKRNPCRIDYKVESINGVIISLNSYIEEYKPHFIFWTDIDKDQFIVHSIDYVSNKTIKNVKEPEIPYNNLNFLNFKKGKYSNLSSFRSLEDTYNES